MPSKKASADDPPPVQCSAAVPDAARSDISTSHNNAVSVLRSITNNPSVAATIASSTLTQLNLNKITRESQLYVKSVDYTVTVHDGLTGSQAAVIDDTGPTIPELSLELFFTKVLPCPPIAKKTIPIFQALCEGDDPAYANGRWAAFPDDPGKTEERETAVFSRLERVAEAVIEQARRHNSPEAVTRFRNDPDLVPESRWRETTSRPDGFFVLRKRRSATVAHWADIAATGEYKRKDGDLRHLEDDSKKVLWNMHQTLRDDPTRRFTFGFTIENRSMRVWYCSRAKILVCKPFDFMIKARYLVRFFLAFTFSKVDELGWDPTMKFVDSPKPYYIINVRSPQGKKMRFKTEGLLSSVGAEAIRGRGTRVWKVRQWVGERAIGPEMALKDCWIDSDRPQEGEVMESIRASAKSNSEHRKVLDRGLLTTFIHGDVHVTDDTVDRTLVNRQALLQGDGWFLVHRSDELMKTFETCAKSAAAKKNVVGAHRGLHDHLSNTELKPITYHSKRHYRIVFREICTAFRDEVSLSSVFRILSETCIILKSLHAIGWVHRDISAGNVLVDGATGVTKLADVEYAKRIGRTSGNGHHDIRTGTLDFMSIEVAHTSFLFQSDGDDTSVRWFYNPLHDLESVWWLAAWSTLNRDIYFIHPTQGHITDNAILTSHVGVLTRLRQRMLRNSSQHPRIPAVGHSGAIDADDDQIVPEGFVQETRAQRAQRLKAQHAIALKLFAPKNATSLRVNVLLGGVLGYQIDTNKPLHPIVNVLGVRLREARRLLTSSFRKAEANLSQLPGKATHIANGLHDQFNVIFDNARKHIEELGVEVRVRRLSDEHRKIKDAEDLRRAKLTEAKAEGVTRLAMYARVFHYSSGDSSDRVAKQPPRHGNRQGRVGSCHDRRRTHTLPSVPEDQEIEEINEPRSRSSSPQHSETAHALTPIPEDEETEEPRPVAPKTKHGRAHHNDGKAAVAQAGPSRPTRKSARTAPYTKSPSRGPQRQASDRAPPASKRKRAGPTARAATPAQAPRRSRQPQPRADSQVPALVTTRADESPAEASRPRKKRRIEAEASPPRQGRVLRPRKR